MKWKEGDPHPLNSLDLSQDGRFVECWSNGRICLFIRISQIHDAVAYGQEWFFKHLGGPGTVSRDLRRAMDASDAALSALAFGGQYR